MATLVIGAFRWLYWWFDARRCFYSQPSCPPPSHVWIVLPTVDGAAFAGGVAWYDSLPHAGGHISNFLGRTSEYSCSIYPTHFLIVAETGRLISVFAMPWTNFYVACGAGSGSFQPHGAVIAFKLPIYRDTNPQVQGHYVQRTGLPLTVDSLSQATGPFVRR